MPGWARAAVVGVILAFAAGVGVIALQRSREAGERTGCLNRFRKLGEFAAEYVTPPPGKARAQLDDLAVPAGTVVNPNLKFDQRLSWIAGNLAALSPRDAALAGRFDRNAAWDADAHRELIRTHLPLFTCPGRTPEMVGGEPALTQFVGVGGVGPDAATLELGPPVPNRAGCFRYDTPTPLKLIAAHDGLSQSILFAEVANNLGPWARGGPATIRCVDPTAPDWRTTQFLGNYPNASGFGMADGSARFVTYAGNPQVLLAMFTIAGTGFDPLSGE